LDFLVLAAAELVTFRTEMINNGSRSRSWLMFHSIIHPSYQWL